MLDPDDPFAHGSLTDAEGIWELRMSLIDGFNNARVIIPKVFHEFSKKFGRLNKDMIEIVGDIDNAMVGIIAIGL